MLRLSQVLLWIASTDDVVGNAFPYLPGAIGEQSGQLAGQYSAYKLGSNLGRPFGAPGRIIGGILGPMAFTAMQVVGPTAEELAEAHGRPGNPDPSDWAQALLTGGAVGLLDRVGLGAIMKNPATQSALRNVATRGAVGVLGEGATETAQALTEQVGSTYGTPGGVETDWMQALGEGAIGAGAGGTMGSLGAIGQEAVGALPGDERFLAQQALREQAGLRGIDPEMQRVFATGEQVAREAPAYASVGATPGEETSGFYELPQEGQQVGGLSAVIVENAFQKLERTLGRRPTRKEVQQAVRDIVQEESISHKAFLEMLQDRTGFLDAFYSKRKGDIETWLNTLEIDGGGEAYRGYDNIGAAAEFIASKAREQGINSNLVRRIISSIRNFLRKKGALGFDADFSDQHIYDLITKASRQAEAGTPGEAPTITPEGVLESRGLQDPSRRRFMKQVGGAAVGAAVDPSILLEPATPEAVEAPMYTGMTEQFPGSVYEFSIAVDPNAGWTSSDDPGEGAIDVAFTHDPNTNEVVVYEGAEEVNRFEVDDMHADAEVLEYVRDEYGSANINDARVQREEMERDPITGEGGFDYWGDADDRF